MVTRHKPIKGTLGQAHNVQADPRIERVQLLFNMTDVKVPADVDKPSSRYEGQSRQGKCYELSASFILGLLGSGNKDWTEVHGLLNPPIGPFSGENYEHAWCERGDLVYESVFDAFYKKDEYYKVYEPKVKKRYSERELRKNVLKHKTWGPW